MACAVGSFFYAAAVNPQSRKKAQEEIFQVTGGDRLPTFEDRPSLPYVEAFYREVMRWKPAMPMGVAHTTTEDDVYEGCFIPKGKEFCKHTAHADESKIIGSTIMSNIWYVRIPHLQ